MQDPEFVFQVTRPINELDAPTGSFIVFRPEDPECKVYVVRPQPGYEAYLLRDFNRLKLSSQRPPVTQASAFEHLLRVLQVRESA